MRTRDKNKSCAFGKAAKTISFDRIVLEKLEARALNEGTTVSHFVNATIRRIVLSDAGFYREMMREHWKEFQHYKYLREECEALVNL